MAKVSSFFRANLLFLGLLSLALLQSTTLSKGSPGLSSSPISSFPSSFTVSSDLIEAELDFTPAAAVVPSADRRGALFAKAGDNGLSNKFRPAQDVPPSAPQYANPGLARSASSSALPAIAAELVAMGLSKPVAIAHAGDGSGRLFVTLQGGQIIIIDGAQVLPIPFLNIASLVSSGSERGLLSTAFHPHYSDNGYFFVNYTDKAGDTVVARYSVSADPNVADPSSAQVLLTIAQPFANHNGGQIQFGHDGYLYIAMGDGGSAGDPLDLAQNLGSLMGKMLRIDVDTTVPYAIPPDNPFAGNPQVRDEIWAFGLRNPWRFSFDRLTGDLFVADVGQFAWEEVDFQAANSPGGENYGWRLMEGNHCFNPPAGCDNGSLTGPIIEYDHTVGCSITGGYRYRGNENTSLEGSYIYGDYCSGRIWGAIQDVSGWTVSELLDTPFVISTFGEDETGELYFTHYSPSDAAIYRLVAVAPPQTLNVTTAGTGTGTVTSDPAGIDCGPDCSEPYVSGTPVTLTATPDAGSTFAGWGGDSDCSDGQVTMDSDKTCTATFDLLDTTAPSIPQNMTISPTEVDAAILSWDASTDTGGSGVAGYRVYDTKTGAEVTDVSGISHALTSLVADDHSYFVKAYDVAGNVSARSRFAATRLPVRFAWQSVDILGSTFAANPAGGTAKASFVFEGNSVTIDYGCGLNTGIFEVSIDGAVVDTVDAYCSPPDFNAQKTYVVAPGGHALEVRPTGNTNPSSSYFWTLIDGFEVAGEKYEEDDGVIYTWQTVDISGSTFSANPAGATASASFTYAGDNVSVNYGCGLNTGIFDVEIDGVLQETVDAYCSPADYSAQKTYPTTLDTHTITVRPAGTKNTSSSYFWTLIDSFEVSGGIFEAQALPSSEAEELYIPESRLSKLLQRLPKPTRERIENRLEKAGGVASADTIALLNSEKLTRLLERLEGKRDEE